MKQWSEMLFIFGLLVLLISFFAQGKTTPVFTALTYIISFGAGVIFQTDGVDPGGAKTNNLWIIWTAAFKGFILIGIVCETIAANKTKNKYRIVQV